MENLVKDFEMNSSLEKVLSSCVFMSLFFLALGALTSISILSLSHVFIILPALYFIPKANYKNYPKSAWALLAFALVLVLSIVVNQDIIANGYKNISKTKYFFIGFLSIAPLSWYLKKQLTPKRLSILLYVFLIAATVSTVVGLKNHALQVINSDTKEFTLFRNTGLMGGVMNYAHNMNFVLIILFGLLLYRDKVKKYINLKFLILVFIINFIGFYFSYTRGAWLGFLVAVPFFFIRKPRIFVSIILLGTLLGAGIYFTAGRSVKRADNDQTRVGLWQASYEAFKERPVLGYGYLNFEPHSKRLKEKYGFFNPNFSGQSHSNLMEVLSTTGMLGFLVCFIWNLLWVIELFKRKDSMAILGIVLWVGFAIAGLTQSTLALGVNLFAILASYFFVIASNQKEY